jgi:hypothetical protein
MTVGDEKILDVRNRQAQFVKGLGTLGTAIDQQVVIPLHDQEVGLVVTLGEGAPYADKKELKGAVVGERQWSFAQCFYMHSLSSSAGVARYVTVFHFSAPFSITTEKKCYPRAAQGVIPTRETTYRSYSR